MIPRLGRRLAPLAVALAVLPLAARAETVPPATPEAHDRAVLRYRGFLAGAPIGEAEVEVVVADGGYRVDGDARSNGWLDNFSRWRNRFSANGLLDGVVKAPASFSYTETSRDKHRHVVVQDGTLQVTKDGLEREPKPAPDGPDVVSALFVEPRCEPDLVVHTGRHAYRLHRLDHGETHCRYAVTDEDDERFEIGLVLARHDNLLVPEKITVHGWVTGSIELVGTGTR